jgi:hypothetical protein
MRPFLFCSTLILSFYLTAQTESWNGVSFEHEVSEKWAYVIEMEHRRSLTASPDGTFLFLLAGNRPLAKNLSITSGTRFEPSANGDAGTFRVFSDLNYKYPLGNSPFTLESRLRYQQDRPLGEDGSLRRVSLRPRIGLAAELTKKIGIVGEFEGRFRFDQRDEWSRVRYTVGLEYKATDRLSLEIFWRQEDRVNQASARSTTIFGLYADYTLPDDRPRKWKYRHPFGRSVTW